MLMDTLKTITGKNKSYYMNILIFKNTIFLFFRMMVVVFLSLITIRLLLEKVGFEDYGIFILASSVIYLSSFITGALNTIATRYISNSLVLGDEKTKDTFSDLLKLTFTLVLIIGFILYLIYVYIIPNYIVLKSEYIYIFNMVYVFSCLVFLIDFLKTPFNALLISLEKISIYSFFEILTSFIRFSSVFLLGYINYDDIISYSLLIFVFSLALAIFYVGFCVKKIGYFRFSLRGNGDIGLLFNVSLWDIYGNFCSLLRFQGITILINNFFGALIIAAVGISNQIQSMGMMLVSNLSTAMKPRIFKCYAENNHFELINLVNILVKSSTILLLLVLIPYFLEYQFLLEFWLGSYPKEVVDISRLILIFLIFANLSMCAILILHAIGDFKKPSIINGTLYLLIPVVTYYLYSKGGEYYLPFFINIFAVMLGGFLNLIYVKVKFKDLFSFYDFYIKSFLHVLSFGFLVFLFLSYTKNIIIYDWVRFIFISILNLIIFMIYSYFYLLDLEMKVKIRMKIKGFLK